MLSVEGYGDVVVAYRAFAIGWKPVTKSLPSYGVLLRGRPTRGHHIARPSLRNGVVALGEPNVGDILADADVHRVDERNQRALRRVEVSLAPRIDIVDVVL